MWSDSLIHLTPVRARQASVKRRLVCACPWGLKSGFDPRISIGPAAQAAASTGTMRGEAGLPRRVPEFAEFWLAALDPLLTKFIEEYVNGEEGKPADEFFCFFVFSF